MTCFDLVLNTNVESRRCYFFDQNNYISDQNGIKSIVVRNIGWSKKNVPNIVRAVSANI